MDSRLLDRFYKGECSQEEVQEVLRWFRESRPESTKERDLHAIWQEAAQRPVGAQEHDAEQVFRRIRAKIGEPQEQTIGVIPFRRAAALSSWAKVAAAVLLPLILVGVLVLYTSRSGTVPAAYTYSTVEAAPGVKKTIRLPDGSTIKLNAGSSVSFDKNFDAATREITLQGEAFFEVAKDSLRPFIVHTGSISTQALGTSFNIDYSLHDSTITVALATGVVKVEKKEQGSMRQLSRLVPGQQLSYHKASQQYTVAPFDRSEVLAWKEGVLSFKKANLSHVVRELENWYGVGIEVDTAGGQSTAWNYTGEYRQESLEKVLDGIGFVKGFTYTRAGNHVKIIFNRASDMEKRRE